MNQKLNLELSPELEVYRQQIEATIEPYIAIKLTDNSNPTWWQSKFGGLPYMPKDFTYPKSEAGEYLYLLAQINFAEVPALAPLPHQGILQFYIAIDHMFGLDFDNQTKQDMFRVVYFPNVYLSEQEIVTDFSFLPSEKKGNGYYDDYLPFSGCSKIKFEVKYAPMSLTDYQFNLFSYGNVCDRVFDEYGDKSEANGHKLLGYPDFTQEDPRTVLTEDEAYILLLQIDTDNTNHENNGFEIMWGDSGVANFFIKQSALERLDFSDVLYNWDCT